MCSKTMATFALHDFCVPHTCSDAEAYSEGDRYLTDDGSQLHALRLCAGTTDFSVLAIRRRGQHVESELDTHLCTPLYTEVRIDGEVVCRAHVLICRRIRVATAT